LRRIQKTVQKFSILGIISIEHKFYQIVQVESGFAPLTSEACMAVAFRPAKIEKFRLESQLGAPQTQNFKIRDL
jgi:hypothetical protein